MFLAVWWRRLWLFLDRDRVRRELEEEMQLHRDLRARAMERGGAAPVDAAAAARRRFGHEVTLAERSQESWGFQRGDELRWNVRYALRRLANRPAYAATIVLVMGLGIGATTAMFSAVDAVMLRALPFREPSRLVSLIVQQDGFAEHVSRTVLPPPQRVRQDHDCPRAGNRLLFHECPSDHRLDA